MAMPSIPSASMPVNPTAKMVLIDKDLR
jgi:hypothetical protein